MKVTLYILLLFCILLSSCSPYSYFTKGNKAAMEKAGLNLKKVQFYLDRKVNLSRIVSSEDAKLMEGKIRFINGEYIYLLKIKRFTPCVCEDAGDNKMVLRFEGGEGKTFSFMCDQNEMLTYNIIGPKVRPDLEKEREVFSILGTGWGLVHGNKYFGTVSYENVDYTLKFRTRHRVKYVGDTPFMPSLLVSKNKNFDVRISRRLIRGRKVS